MLASHPAECLDYRNIGDDIDHVAIDVRCLARIAMMKRRSARCPIEHDNDHDTDNRCQCKRHRDAYGRQIDDRHDRRDKGWYGVERHHRLGRIEGVGSGGDAARQSARGLTLKKAWGMAGQMPEKFSPDTAGNAGERRVPHPRRQPP